MLKNFHFIAMKDVDLLTLQLPDFHVFHITWRKKNSSRVTLTCISLCRAKGVVLSGQLSNTDNPAVRILQSLHLLGERCLEC